MMLRSAPAMAPDTPGRTQGGPADVTAGRPRACDLEARGDRLLDTAAALFIANGYAGTSLEMIAREGRVAVRTIYVKFGGKSGLLRAVIVRGRAAYATRLGDMAHDIRPLETVLTDFGMRFLELVSAPESVALQRIAIAESHRHPEVRLTFYDAGIGQTYAVLAQFFARRDIGAQLRDDLDRQQLPAFLISCVIGDPLERYLFDAAQTTDSERLRGLKVRVDLFLRGVLR